MDKRLFISFVMFFILIMTGVPFYWFAYQPNAVRQQCLALSLGTAFDELESRDSAAAQVSEYFSKRGGLKGSSSSLSQAKQSEALYLIMRQKEGYQICLELNGLKE